MPFKRDYIGMIPLREYVGLTVSGPALKGSCGKKVRAMSLGSRRSFYAAYLDGNDPTKLVVDVFHSYTSSDEAIAVAINHLRANLLSAPTQLAG